MSLKETSWSQRGDEAYFVLIGHTVGCASCRGADGRRDAAGAAARPGAVGGAGDAGLASVDLDAGADGAAGAVHVGGAVGRAPDDPVGRAPGRAAARATRGVRQRGRMGPGRGPSPRRWCWYGGQAAVTGVNCTGRRCGPRVKTPCSTGSKPSASRMSGMASSSWLTPISTSALASSAPTQKCRPSAKARWSAAAEKAVVRGQVVAEDVEAVRVAVAALVAVGGADQAGDGRHRRVWCRR